VFTSSEHHRQVHRAFGGPSNSIGITDCHVPSTSLPLDTGIASEDPRIDEAMCDQAARDYTRVETECA
jgi:hypothetical protein